MDWLFENLGKVITAIVTIVYVLGSLRGSGKQEAEEEEKDPEALARARRIQEEIRRKILERQRGAAPESEQPQPEPYGEGPFADLFPPPAVEVPSRPLGDDAPWRPVRPEPIPLPERPILHYSPEDNEESGEDPFEEQRRQIEEQLRKARDLRDRVRVGKREASAADYAHAYRKGATDPTQLRQKVQRDLSDVASLRAAFVLKEILDKPVGLR